MGGSEGLGGWWVGGHGIFWEWPIGEMQRSDVGEC